MSQKKTLVKYFFLMLFIGITAIPILVVASPPPEPEPGFILGARSSKILGIYVSGDDEDLWYNDGETLCYQANEYWFLSWKYDQDMWFYFLNYKCSEVNLEFSDNSLWSNGFITLYAYYTTGSREYLGCFHEGTHVIDIDSSRVLVKLLSYWDETSGWGWKRYIHYDVVTAVVA